MGLTDKGISLASGFKFQAGRPLDVRSIVENTTERDELISSNAAYLGMRVYVKSVDKSYYYTASGWKEVPVGAMYTHPSTHPATMITEDTNHRFMTDAERTKLSNAPTTINGTKFNGTASITTANWGTTRSIYIADSDATNTGAAVSVNGGANATLKLPATIKASLTGNASTATKLATARSINGTNFDGSGAITTANWGTARNIYIADSDATNTGAAVSVNGGGNATLKLPATIKATLTGNASSASQVYGTATNPSTATSYFLPFHSGSTSGNKSMLTNDGIRYNTLEGTTSANGVSALELGNNVASGTAGNKYGVTRLYGTSSGYTEVKPSNNTTSNITLTLPSSTGTLALTSNNVASATKLATARSINGTNFDGTGNITTANWGTARNISISDSDATNTGAAVSVNGGGNVTLKLPATIKATLSGAATSATNDSAGQNINTTYIKGLSVSGRTITYTKGDGTTGTITTQDTNTTYSVFGKATSDAAGSNGLVPAPAKGAQGLYLRGDGTWATPTNTTYSTGTTTYSGTTKLYTGTGSATDGTMTQKAITDSLNGKANSSHTHNYAGSSSAGGAANSVANAIAIKLNGGTTEGTNLFTFNGSAAKTINITPSSIGAAASSHGTHVSYSTDAPKANGTASAGSSGAVARADHVHPLQTSVSGSAGSATNDSAGQNINTTYIKGLSVSGRTITYTKGDGTTGTITTQDTNTTYSTGTTSASGLTKLYTGVGTNTDGTMTQKAITDALAGKSGTGHTHSYAGSASVGGAANSVANAIAIKLNGGTTEGTNLFTFNGSAAKTINITPSSIGAAASSHGTHVSYSTDAPKANGTASAGSSGAVARADHVHPLQTNISGNAATATSATNDSAGQQINTTYIKGLSISGRTITYTKGDGTTGAITTQDTTYGVATTSANGLMSSSDKSKLDGIAANANNYTHPSSGVTAGTYRSVTVNAQGHVTAGTNPTTLSGYGITDAAAKYHTHGSGDITSIDASKLTGTISIDRLPKGALERLTIVADDTARFKLTTGTIQNGDTVKVTSTGKMYYVVDDTKLSTEDGYEVYTAGSATSVPWSGVTGKPSTYTPSSHTQAISTITGLQSALDGKANSSHGTHVSYSTDAPKANGTASAGSSGAVARADHVHPLQTSVSGSAGSAANDSAGQNISATYIKGLSVSGRTITYTKGNGTTGTITTQDSNTTYGVFGAATSSAAGTSGLVPAPAAGKQGQYLRGDGTWSTPTNTTYGVATTSANGLMSSSDKSKLDGIAANANNYSHPTSSGNKHIPSGGSSGQILRWSADGTAVWGSDYNTTYSAGTGLSLSGTTFNHKNSVTAGTAQGDANKTLSFGGTFTIPTITYDAQGHITGKGSTTMTMPGNPNTDTKNTAGSTDTSSKIFLVGATSQAANPQTYSDNQVYAQNGQLNGNTVRVGEKVTLQYNSTTESLDFVFA